MLLKLEVLISSTIFFANVVLLGLVSVITLTQVVILIVWQVLDPPLMKELSISYVDLLSEKTCSSQSPQIWLSLEAAIFAMLMIWGIYVVYSTWYGILLLV